MPELLKASLRWNSKAARALVAVLLVIFGLFALRIDLLERLELQIYDLQLQFLRAQHAEAPLPAAPVALVGIDEATVEAIPAPLSLWHEPLAELITGISQSDASVLAFDLVLPDRSYDSFLQRDNDRKLLLALAQAKRNDLHVIFGRTLAADGALHPVFGKFQALLRKEGFGVVQQTQEQDAVVRRFVNASIEDELGLPTLVGQIARSLGLPVTDGWIDFTVGEQIDYVSMLDVLEWQRAGNVAKLKEAFSGKVVFVGGVLPFDDRHLQPVVLSAWEENPYAPGVLIHMQSYRSLAADRMIEPVPAWLYLLALAIATTFLFAGNRQLLWLGALALFALAVVFASSMAFESGWRVPMVPLILVATLAWLYKTFVDSVSNLFEKQRMRDAFGGYVSPQILNEIMDGSISPELGGASRKICLMFADICGFTTLSESMDASNVLSLLNRYFDAVTPAIHDHGGTLDKYMGDGIMAFFGAPQDLENPAQAGFDAAREMHAALAVLNEQLEREGKAPIAIGVGLGLGDVVVGHVGARSRFEYSAIGDTVNVTARVEGLTRGLEADIVLTEQVYLELFAADQEQMVDCGVQNIKGHTPVRVYAWSRAG